MRKRLHNLRVDLVEFFIKTCEKSIDTEKYYKRTMYKANRRGEGKTLFYSGLKLSLAWTRLVYSVKREILSKLTK